MMNSIKKWMAVGAVSIVGMTPLFADEGGGNHGGGDVIVCNNGMRGLGWLRSKNLSFRLADTHHISKEFLQKLDTFKTEELELAFVESLNRQQPNLGDLAAETVEKLFGPRNEKVNWVSKLKNFDDDNIDTSSLPKRCRVKQLAIQNVDTMKLKVHTNRYYKLSRSEKVFFKFHEAFIYLANAPEDTTGVRKFIGDTVEFDFLSIAEYIAKDIVPHRNYTYLEKLDAILRAIELAFDWTALTFDRNDQYTNAVETAPKYDEYPELKSLYKMAYVPTGELYHDWTTVATLDSTAAMMYHLNITNSIDLDLSWGLSYHVEPETRPSFEEIPGIFQHKYAIQSALAMIDRLDFKLKIIEDDEKEPPVYLTPQQIEELREYVLEKTQ